MASKDFDFDIHKRRPRKTDEFLLASLRAYLELKKGQYFGVAEWDKWPKRAATSGTYIKRFGSWRKALQKTGMETVGARERAYDAEFLIRMLKDCWVSLGVPPSTKEFDRYCKDKGLQLSSGPYRTRWGSVRKACEAIHKHHHGQIDDFELYNPPKRPHQQRQTISPSIKLEVFERDNWTCQRCGATRRTNKDVELEVDHIISISTRRRGKIPAHIDLNAIDNLQTLCRSCNVAKSDK